MPTEKAKDGTQKISVTGKFIYKNTFWKNEFFGDRNVFKHDYNLVQGFQIKTNFLEPIKAHNATVWFSLRVFNVVDGFWKVQVRTIILIHHGNNSILREGIIFEQEYPASQQGPVFVAFPVEIQIDQEITNTEFYVTRSELPPAPDPTGNFPEYDISFSEVTVPGTPIISLVKVIGDKTVIVPFIGSVETQTAVLNTAQIKFSHTTTISESFNIRFQWNENELYWDESFIHKYGPNAVTPKGSSLTGSKGSKETAAVGTLDTLIYFPRKVKVSGLLLNMSNPYIQRADIVQTGYKKKGVTINAFWEINVPDKNDPPGRFFKTFILHKGYFNSEIVYLGKSDIKNEFVDDIPDVWQFDVWLPGLAYWGDDLSNYQMYMRGTWLENALKIYQEQNLVISSGSDSIRNFPQPGIGLNSYRYLEIEMKIKNLSKSKSAQLLITTEPKSIVKSWNFNLSGLESLKFINFNWKRFDLCSPMNFKDDFDDTDHPYPRFDVNDLSNENQAIDGPYYGINRATRIEVTNSENIEIRNIRLVYKYPPIGFWLPSLNWSEERKTSKNGRSEKTNRLFQADTDGNTQTEEGWILTDKNGKNNYIDIKLFSFFINAYEGSVKVHQGWVAEGDSSKKYFDAYTLGGLITIKGNEINFIGRPIIKNTDFEYIPAQEYFRRLVGDVPPFLGDYFKVETTDTFGLRPIIYLRGNSHGIVLNKKSFPKLNQKVELRREEDFALMGEGNSADLGLYETFYPYGNGGRNHDTIAGNINALGPDPLYSRKRHRFVFKVAELLTGVQSPYLSSAMNKISNQIMVSYGESYNSLDPNTEIATDKDIELDGNIRIYNVNPQTSNSYNLSINNNDSQIFDWYPKVINKNTENNNNFNLFTETYKFSNTSPEAKSQSLAFTNKFLDNDSTWANYNQYENIISKLCGKTENNTYDISPVSNDIYVLGTFKESLILQFTSFDQIIQITSEESFNTKASDAKYSILIDGNNLSSDDLKLFPEIDQSATDTAPVSKFYTIIAIGNDELVILYSLKDDNSKFYYRTYVKSILSERKLLFDASSFMKNSNYSVSNIDAIYDQTQNLMKFIFILSDNINSIQLFYAESNYNTSNLSEPSLFHSIVGNFNKELFKSNVLSYNDISSTLIFQKPTLTMYENRYSKGAISIFYVDIDKKLFTVDLIPNSSLSEPREIT